GCSTTSSSPPAPAGAAWRGRCSRPRKNSPAPTTRCAWNWKPLPTTTPHARSIAQPDGSRGTAPCASASRSTRELRAVARPAASGYACGMSASAEPVPLSLCVLTVSDSRTPDNDTSGDWLVEALQAAGHRLADRALLPDDRYLLRARVSQWIADDGVDGIIVTGGTGFTGR